MNSILPFVQVKNQLCSKILTLCAFFFVTTLSAQDLQFSQFHNAPIYLNPAFAGIHQGGRMTLNYRNQWPALDVNYVTYAGGFDYYFSNIRSTVGAIVKVDEQGGGTMLYKSTDFSLIYGYLIPLSNTVAIQPALQVGYVQRQAGFNELTFPDQFTDDGFTGVPTDENFARTSLGFVDVSTGFMLFGENFWIGVSGHHINSPSDSFIGDENRLPIKLSVHGGYKINMGTPYDERERSFTPTFMYKRQGSFQQINLGGYAVYEPLVAGLWYRGFPLEQSTNNYPKHDAVIAMLGVKFGDWQLAYSYDWSISEIAAANAVSHELSLVFLFGGKDDIQCPNPFSAPRRTLGRYRR